MRLAQSFGRARRRACSPDLSPISRASLIPIVIPVASCISASGLRCNKRRVLHTLRDSDLMCRFGALS
jgi:hypothetical protein